MSFYKDPNNSVFIEIFDPVLEKLKDQYGFRQVQQSAALAAKAARDRAPVAVLYNSDSKKTWNARGGRGYGVNDWHGGAYAGNLRDSINWTIERDARGHRYAQVQARTPYALFVHDGFTHVRSGKQVAGRPFLKAAMKDIGFPNVARNGRTRRQ